MKVVSANESITEDASVLMESLLEGMAEYYSRELSQKVKRGIRKSLIKGHYIGGYVSYGYDVVDKKFVINLEESEKEYVLTPEVINKISKVVVNKFNSELSNNFVLNNLKRELKEKDNAINSILDAIEQGIVTKSAKERPTKNVTFLDENNKKMPFVFKRQFFGCNIFYKIELKIVNNLLQFSVCENTFAEECL